MRRRCKRGTKTEEKKFDDEEYGEEGDEGHEEDEGDEKDE